MKALLHSIVLLALLLANLTACGAALTFTWDANADGGITRGYMLRAKIGSTTFITQDAGLATTNTISGLTNGIPYSFTVTAYNTNRVESPESAPLNYTIPVPPPPIPATPKNLRVTVTGPNNFHHYEAAATWDPVESAEAYVATLSQGGMTVDAKATKDTTLVFKRVPRGLSRLNLVARSATGISAPATVGFSTWQATIGKPFIGTP